jgi:DNA-binding transcriptional LysR family regulator
LSEAFGHFRVGFVTGSTPDKWARTWRERYGRDEFELVPLEESEQEDRIRAGTLDMALVRLPVDRDGLHLIQLYEELPVAVMGTEHLLTLTDELTTADLADEQLVIPERSGWTPTAEQLAWPQMTAGDAIEVVAGGTGVAVLPMSIARLHHRKDVTYRVVTDLPPTQIGLTWLVDNDDPWVQRFIGIVRGRSERSSRR